MSAALSLRPHTVFLPLFAPPPQVYITASGVGAYASHTTTQGPECTESTPLGLGFFPKLVQQWEAAATQAAVGDWGIGNS